MPARSAVSSLLAAPAPAPAPALASVSRQCLFFLYPASTYSRSRSPLYKQAFFPRATPTPTIRRPFHHTAPRRDDAIDNARNHYETLKVAPSASPADIKKSFYALSKTHHPDLHEASSRRAAAKRFMRISEAYSILSSPSKRAKYDREHPHLHSHSHSHSHPHGGGQRSGSYASTHHNNPAGGRPASGLSRRRGTFQGPPPSFFRSGGWGAQAEKRRAAHEESTGFGTGGMGTVGGMGPGQDPFGHRDDVPHFDKEAHQRTGRHSDRRREARRAAAAAAAASNAEGDEHGSRRRRVAVEPERGVAGMFFAIGGILLLSFIGPFFLSRLWSATARKTKEKG